MNSWKPKLPPFRRFKKEVFLMAAITGQLLYQIGESSALRKPSNNVPASKIKSEEFQQKIEYLKNCLLRYRKLTGVGRGLTAIQVGIPQNFSVIYKAKRVIGKKKLRVGRFKDLMIIINPKITKKSKEKYLYPEMCMSANPIIAPVARPTWIEFEYYDERGNLKFWKTKDENEYGRILNRVFQHEIDHMEGIINIDLCKSSDLILESDPKFYETAKFQKV